MATKVIRNSGVSAYNVNSYIVDDKEDLDELKSCASGSSAFVSSTGIRYLKNLAGEWVALSGNSGSGGGIDWDNIESLTEADILDITRGESYGG